MPKAILEFNLPEESEEYNTTMNASNYSCAIWEMYNYLRGRRKYEEMSEEKGQILDEIWDKFWDILKEAGVSEDF